MINKQDLVLKKINGLKLYIDRQDPGISASLMKPKFFRKWHREPVFMDLIESEVAEGDVAFDLGANIGYITTLLAKYVGVTGKVYGVEPSPRNFEILKKNILLNNQAEIVEVSQMAISGSSGSRELNISSQSNLNSFTWTKHSVDSITVDTKSIDDFFEERRYPNFIKMDIEGAEVEALAGMDRLLSCHDGRLRILIEVHPMYYDGAEFSQQLRRLFSKGFHTKYLCTAGTAMPDYFVEKGYRPIKIYRTGPWSRGLYKNVKEDDVIESCGAGLTQEVRMPWASFFKNVVKNPKSIGERTLQSSKIVRSILLERG